MPQAYAFKDREYWSARKVGDKWIPTKLRCSACGYQAPHYQVSYDGSLAHVFAVPYAGLNGGIGHEIGAEPWIEPDDKRELEDLMLSKCCDAPSASSLRKINRRKAA
jgi:hypothetical protein